MSLHEDHDWSAVLEDHLMYDMHVGWAASCARRCHRGLAAIAEPAGRSHSPRKKFQSPRAQYSPFPLAKL